MRACSVCGCAQWDTPSGPMCPNNHGGAPSVEKPEDATARTAELQGYLVRLEDFVRRGGQLAPEQALWLIETAKGGIWGRMAASASNDARAHRFALRSIVKGLLDRTSERWTGAHWRPILALLSPRATDCDTLGAVPEGSRLDVGVRLVEAGELHE